MTAGKYTMREKLLKTKELLKTVLYHDEWYIDLIMASFASCTKLCLLGYRATGKTHALRSMTYMVDEDIVARVQGYLSASREEVFARLHAGKLVKEGEEKIIWKKVVRARVKFFDEIQRLGADARNMLFRALEEGEFQYHEEVFETDPAWWCMTANPTEEASDVENQPLPEPLWDRIDAVVWFPVCRGIHFLKITGEEQEKAKRLPVIWSEEDLLKMWEEVRSIPVPRDLHMLVSLMMRIMLYCRHAVSNDGTSLPEHVRRMKCSECGQQYLCSKLARPPSVRAKRSWFLLAKGFAYLRGHEEVTEEDLRDAFIPVFWKRMKFMDENDEINKHDALRRYYDQLKAEASLVLDVLKRAVRGGRLPEDVERNVETFKNAHPWAEEFIEDIVHEIRRKFEEDKAIVEALLREGRWDEVGEMVHLMLNNYPVEYFKDLYLPLLKVEVPLDPKNRGKLLMVVDEKQKKVLEKVFKNMDKFVFKGTPLEIWWFKKHGVKLKIVEVTKEKVNDYATHRYGG